MCAQKGTHYMSCNFCPLMWLKQQCPRGHLALLPHANWCELLYRSQLWGFPLFEGRKIAGGRFNDLDLCASEGSACVLVHRSEDDTQDHTVHLSVPTPHHPRLPPEDYCVPCVSLQRTTGMRLQPGVKLTMPLMRWHYRKRARLCDCPDL